jgi:hypothetical protein
MLTGGFVRLTSACAALWRGTRQAIAHMGAAWRDARGRWGHRQWPRVYWQSLVSHAGKRQAQRLALSALIVALIVTSSGGYFLTTFVLQRLQTADSTTTDGNAGSDLYYWPAWPTARRVGDAQQKDG